MKKLSFLSLLAGIAVSLAAVTSCDNRKPNPDKPGPNPDIVDPNKPDPDKPDPDKPTPDKPEIVIPTVLERLTELKSAENFVVGVSGEIETTTVDDAEAPLKLNTIFERTYEITPLAWTRTHLMSKNNTIVDQENSILLNPLTDADGVAMLIPDENGNIKGGKLPSTVAKSYTDIIPNAIADLNVPTNKPDVVEKLSVQEYTFDLSVSQLGQPNNITDVLNMIYLAQTIQIDQYVDIISDVTVKSTAKDLQVSFLIENTDPETASTYPVLGAVDAQFIVGAATDYADLQTQIFAPNELPTFEINADYQALLDMVNQNCYRIELNMPAKGEQPAITESLWYGKDYFAITQTLTDEPHTILGRQAFTIKPVVGLEVWTDVPVDPKDPNKGTQVGIVEAIPAAKIEADGLTLEEFLHLFVEQQLGLPYLEDNAEFNGVLPYLATNYIDQIFNNPQIPGGFLFEDFGDALRLNFDKDFNSYPVPASYTEPFSVDLTGVLWGKGSADTIADDEIYLATIMLNGMGSFQLPFTGFGVECPFIAEIDAIRNAAQEPANPAA